jgi:FkbM family methyltransferase
MVKLYTDDEHDLEQEIYTRYVYSHYEVCGKTPKRFKKVMLDDNIHNLNVDEVTRKYLLDKFTIKKEDVVLEIGAYYGFGTVKLSELANTVITIEADRYNFNMVEKNIQANAIDNVILINKAVGKEEGKALFYSRKGEIGEAKSLYKQPIKNIKQSYEVDVDTVDNILNGTGIEKVNFITMEINLGEIDALYGMSGILSNDNMRLIAAGWYNYKGRPACFTIKEILTEHGFSVYIGVKNRIYAIKE